MSSQNMAQQGKQEKRRVGGEKRKRKWSKVESKDDVLRKEPRGIMFLGKAVERRRAASSIPEALGFLLNSGWGYSGHPRSRGKSSRFLPLYLAFVGFLQRRSVPKIGSPHFADAHRQCRGLIIFSESNIPFAFCAVCDISSSKPILTCREVLTKKMNNIDKERSRRLLSKR